MRIVSSLPNRRARARRRISSSRASLYCSGNPANSSRSAASQAAIAASAHTVSVQLWSPPKGTPALVQHDVWPDRGELRFATTFDAPIKQAPGVVSGFVQDVAQRLERPKKLSLILVSDKKWWMTKVEIDGMKYSFKRVNPGKYRVIAKSGQNAIGGTEWFVVKPGEKCKLGALRTTPAGSILIRLKRGPATEAVEPTIWINPKSLVHGQSVKLGNKNEHRIPSLSAGVHSYTMRTRGVVTKRGMITVTAGREVELVLPLIAAIYQEIEIKWPAGEQTPLHAQITDAKGKSYWSRNEYDTRSKKSLREKFISLPLGSYVLSGETTSAKGIIQFEIKSLDPDQAPVLWELH